MLLYFPPKHITVLYLTASAVLPILSLALKASFPKLEHNVSEEPPVDKDMDAPLPEELELLEANYRVHEDYLDIEPPEPYPLDEEEEQPTHSKSPPYTPVTPSPETQINGHKRFRPLDGPSLTITDDAGPSYEKRCRIDNTGPYEPDDGWLRYSPPLESNDNVEERVDGVAEEKLVCRFVSEIEGDFVPVTAPSGGDRVYAKMSRVEMEERQKKLNVRAQSGGLLLEPINVLLHKMEQERFTKALQASSRDPGDMVLPETSVIHEQLWVDKYAPNSFMELLSDEQTNREVLLWLKQWDSCVFGSDVRTTSDEVLSALRRHSSISQHQRSSSYSNFNWKNREPRWNKERFRHSNDFNDNRSNLKNIQDLWNKKSQCIGPPEQKILLLCGPPGLGKTTLAHVAAKHCGYRVVEVNASDDRSSSTIEAKILDVVQMNSVTVDARPKCLVIDEIDGALGDGKGAVEVILKMVNADKKSDAGKENSGKEEIQRKKSGKKGHKTAPLLRPVICICNDLYAPAVRPLRQIAKVHVFVQPTVSRVVSRLKYICNKEGMKTSSIALTALAEFTECDIRSCLNTLQFLDKKKEALNVLDIGSQVVGQKDMSRSAFDIWKEIFQNRKQKQKKRYCSRQTMSNDFDSLHSLISNRGDYDLIMDGIHENILHLHYHDPMMRKTVKSLNNLGVSELMQQYVMHTHRMQLLVYSPAIAISIHRLVAQDQKATIEWPKSYQRYRTSFMEKMDILRSWYCTIPPQISRQFSTKSFVEESVSPLLHILSPSTLRPVALKLMSDKEKNDLAQLVSTMVSYSITYRNVKCDSLGGGPGHGVISDESSLAFDPPINEFTNFKGYRSDRFVLALAMKQVVVHEVEKQRILQVGGGRSVNLTDEYNKENVFLLGKETYSGTVNPTGSCAVKVIKKTSISNLWQSNPTTPTSLSNLDSNKCATTAGPGMKLKSLGGAKRSSNSSSSFFERFRKPSSKSSHSKDYAVEEETPERDLRPVLFKFNEGFTNAVKRPVRIREFLL